MSYILEALKKSEQERALESGTPDLASQHGAGPPLRSRPGTATLVALVVAGLVLANASAWLWFRDTGADAPPAAAVTAPAPAATQDPPERSAPARRLPAAAAPDQSAVADADSFAGAPDRTLAPGEAARSETPPPQVARTEAAASGSLSRPSAPAALAQQATPPPTIIRPQRDVMAVGELAPVVSDDLPRLDISTHIFTDVASDRQVRINGEFLGEGDAVTNRLRIEEITAGGVVFEFRHGGRNHYFSMQPLNRWPPGG